MRIKIESADVEKVTRTWEGNSYTSYNQWAQLSQGGFVLSFIVSHQSEDEALKPGEYQLDPTSFSSKQGRLSVDRVKLIPARPAAPVKP